MAKPKSNKVYKIICAATRASYTVRPAVWEKRLVRFGVDSETLAQNYLSRSALKMIKEAENPLSMLHELQSRNNIAQKDLLEPIWNEYISSNKVDDDIKTVIEVGETVEGKVEAIETVEA